MRITDQVIEEVDEQLTITSVKPPDMRPNVINIFQNPGSSTSSSGLPQSQPITIPKQPSEPYIRTQSEMTHFGEMNFFPPGGIDAMLSASAPTGSDIPLLPRSHLPDHIDQTKSAESLISHKNEEKPSEILEEVIGNIQPEDEFEKLRLQREQEKLERAKQKLTRTVSIQQSKLENQHLNVVPPLDTDLLIDQLIETGLVQETHNIIEQNKTE